MKYLYLDTSAFAKLYIEEEGSDLMVRFASESTLGALAVLNLTQVEFRSALRRRERNEDISSEEAFTILAAVQKHFTGGWFLSIPFNETILGEALALIDRRPLRAYDAIQLAACLSFGKGQREQDTVTFVCSDKDLIQVAEMESLSVLNPEKL